MYLSKLLSIVRSYLWLLVLALGVASLSTLIMLRNQPVVYETKTQLLVGPSLDSASPDLNSLKIGGQLIQTYAELVQTHPFLESVNNKLEKKVDVNTIENMIDIRQNVDTRILTILVRSYDKKQAVDIANAVAASLVEISPSRENTTDLLRTQMSEKAQNLEQIISSTQKNIQSLETELAQLKSANEASPEVSQTSVDQQTLMMTQLVDERTRLSDSLRTLATIYQVLMDTNTNRLEIIQTADAVTLVNQNLSLRIAVSGLAGLIFALIIIFGIEYFSPTVRVADELSDITGGQMLAEIPRYQRLDGIEIERVVAYSKSQSTAANKYRTAVARLMIDSEESTPQIFTVSGVGVHSTDVAAVTAANLAVAFAQSDRQVVLVDAQFQNSVLTTLFRAEDKAGLSDYLTTRLPKLSVMSIKEVPNLRFLPVGSDVDKGSTVILNPAKSSALFTEMQKEADIIIIATSPISYAAESLSLASQTGSVILTARRGEQRHRSFNNVMDSLHRMNIHVAGNVFDHNRSPFVIRENFLTKSVQSLTASLRSKTGKTTGQTLKS